MPALIYSPTQGVDYRPYQMVRVKGELKELISLPYPMAPDKGDYEAWICIRDKNDPTTLEHVRLASVELLPT